MHKIRIILLLSVCILAWTIANPCRADDVKSGDSRAKLQTYVRNLQDNPDDHNLREKIIKLALSLRPAPAVPPAAKRHLNRGKAAFEAAQTPADLDDAVLEFRQASLAAPWWGSAYYNLGRAQEKAGDYAGAKRSLQLYLAAMPNAKDSEAVQGLIDGIEYKLEKAAREAPPAYQTERARKPEQNFLSSIDGATYKWHEEQRTSTLDHFIKIRGDTAVYTYTSRLRLKNGEFFDTPVKETDRGRIEGRNILWWDRTTSPCSLSDDGLSIICYWTGKASRRAEFQRQR